MLFHEHPIRYISHKGESEDEKSLRESKVFLFFDVCLFHVVIWMLLNILSNIPIIKSISCAFQIFLVMCIPVVVRIFTGCLVEFTGSVYSPYKLAVLIEIIMFYYFPCLILCSHIYSTCMVLAYDGMYRNCINYYSEEDTQIRKILSLRYGLGIFGVYYLLFHKLYRWVDTNGYIGQFRDLCNIWVSISSISFDYFTKGAYLQRKLIRKTTNRKLE